MCNVLRNVDIDNANLPVDGPLDVLRDAVRLYFLLGYSGATGKRCRAYNPGVVWLETVVKGIWLGMQFWSVAGRN